MVVIAGDARILGFGRRDASAEVDRLYRRHADEVLRYVQLVLRSRTDAEDVVQATFIRAFRALARGERVQKPRNWLIKIAHNECRRMLATRSRRAVEVELEEVPVEQAEAGRAESLRAALSQLTPKQRDALVLRELEGRSYSEIARMLEVSESAVETLIFRARRAVREQLEDVLDCEAACVLIEQETLSDEDRRELRAHTRACSACATAERQARGRKGALRRIASSFGFPGFFKTLLGKVLVVAVTASAVGITGSAIAESHPKRLPDVAPLQVDRPEAPPVVGPRHARVRATRAAKAHPALGRRHQSSAGPLHRASRRRVVDPDRETAAVPPSTASPAATASATDPAATPSSEAARPAAGAKQKPLPVLTRAHLPVTVTVPALPQLPAPLPQLPDLPVGVPVPQLATPQLPVPQLPVPQVAVPQLTVPQVPVPQVPAPQLPVQEPPVQAPSADRSPLPVKLPVAAPQVPGLPSVK
jgi:RNA polymerase sigma-70 factor (ECF subfamily)